jgi:Flp pilus assembly pilin Flp
MSISIQSVDELQRYFGGVVARASDSTRRVLNPVNSSIRAWKSSSIFFDNSLKRFIVSEDGPTAVENTVRLALIIVVCLTHTLCFRGRCSAPLRPGTLGYALSKQAD